MKILIKYNFIGIQLWIDHIVFHLPKRIRTSDLEADFRQHDYDVDQVITSIKLLDSFIKFL